jgi:hypothetical protein
MPFSSDSSESSYSKPDHRRSQSNSVYEAYWDDDLDKSHTGYVLPRFFGEYSKLDLVEKVLESKQDVLGTPASSEFSNMPNKLLFPNAREEFWIAQPVCIDIEGSG